MTNRGYLMPDPPEVSGYKCVKVYIPDDLFYLTALTGQLADLATWLAWDKDGTDYATRAAQMWKAANELTLAGIDLGCASEDCPECESGTCDHQPAESAMSVYLAMVGAYLDKDDEMAGINFLRIVNGQLQQSWNGVDWLPVAIDGEDTSTLQTATIPASGDSYYGDVGADRADGVSSAIYLLIDTLAGLAFGAADVDDFANGATGQMLQITGFTPSAADLSSLYNYFTTYADYPTWQAADQDDSFFSSLANHAYCAADSVLSLTDAVNPLWFAELMGWTNGNTFAISEAFETVGNWLQLDGLVKAMQWNQNLTTTPWQGAQTYTNCLGDLTGGSVQLLGDIYLGASQNLTYETTGGDILGRQIYATSFAAEFTGKVIGFVHGTPVQGWQATDQQLLGLPSIQPGYTPVVVSSGHVVSWQPGDQIATMITGSYPNNMDGAQRAQLLLPDATHHITANDDYTINVTEGLQYWSYIASHALPVPPASYTLPVQFIYYLGP